MAVDFAAGCTGGAAGILVGFPFDTVKVRIQTQSMIESGPKYTGTLHCLSSIIKNEGFHSLYRGMSSPLAGVAAMNAIGFGVYGNVNRRLNNPDSLQSVGIAGMCAGLVMSFVCSPMELIKTQMQVKRDNTSAIDTIRSIFREAGYKGFSRGLVLTMTREIPANAIYFTSYEFMVSGRENNTFWVFTAGGISGILSWIFTYPQDVIKSRIQADNVRPDQRVYKGIMHCFKVSLSKEGYGILLRGIGSTIIRAFPVNATTMGTVTLFLHYFSDAQINPHNSMTRLRMADSLQVKLPDAVEKYFNKPYQLPDFYSDKFLHSQMVLPSFNITPRRLFVETILAASPSKYNDDEKELEVGTFRSPIPLSAMNRILSRLLTPSTAITDDEAFHELWKHHREFSLNTNSFGDVILDNRSRFVDEEKRPVEEDSSILPPTMLYGAPKNISADKRRHAITTDDLLQQTSVASNDDKIYGFYYLVT